MTDHRTYLEAKRTVDDRALNRRVLERFEATLAARSAPVRIVELGAGVGAMIARLAAWDRLPADVVYRGVDRDPDSIERARERVPEWLRANGYEVDRLDTDSDDEGEHPALTTFVARSRERRLEITLEVADAFAIEDTADAVIAAAFLDIVSLEEAIPDLKELLVPGGVLYAPITFDGGTTFAPRDPIDDRLEREYHRHMDDVRPEGGSRVGRGLLTRLPGAGWDVLEAGGSDWIVRPRDGRYPAEERVFLEHLLETIDGALAALPEPDLDSAERQRWLERRYGELEDGELVFVAHNLDVLARRC